MFDERNRIGRLKGRDRIGLTIGWIVDPSETVSKPVITRRLVNNYESYGASGTELAPLLKSHRSRSRHLMVERSASRDQYFRSIASVRAKRCSDFRAKMSSGCVGAASAPSTIPNRYPNSPFN